jgi:hypothetical protein
VPRATCAISRLEAALGGDSVPVVLMQSSVLSNSSMLS